MTDYAAEIKQRLNIVDLAMRMGYKVDRSMFIPSIYKDDKTPSLRLYPKTNSFNCFATGHGGDIIQFYQDACNIDFKRALEELCEVAGITKSTYEISKPLSAPVKTYKQEASEDITSCMTEEEKEVYFERLAISENEQESLKEARLRRLETNQIIFSELYMYCLLKGYSEEFWTYLIGERKLPADSVKAFKLFFIKDYSQVNNHLKKVFPLEALQKSGLYNRKDDGTGNLIFYQHRLIIPYLHKGQIVYLRGRYFDQDNNTKTDRCKYIGLGNDLMNLNHTKRFFNSDILSKMLKGEKLYIVEGEFDAIALESIGFNTVCIPGAGNLPSADRFKRLLDYEICICPDNDEAGSKLCDRLGEIFKSYRKEYSIKQLPAKDVNDFIKSGK